jgi:hypothetical protein
MDNETEDAPKKELKTNETFVGELMMFSPYGALCQVFIIEAIRHYSEQVASQPVPADDGTGFISEKAWHGIAVDIQQRMKENYERHA